MKDSSEDDVFGSDDTTRINLVGGPRDGEFLFSVRSVEPKEDPCIHLPCDNPYIKEASEWDVYDVIYEIESSNVAFFKGYAKTTDERRFIQRLPSAVCVGGPFCGVDFDLTDDAATLGMRPGDSFIHPCDDDTYLDSAAGCEGGSLDACYRITADGKAIFDGYLFVKD
jgi:hypothetical protein